MTQYENVDLVAIENRARQMQAQAVRQSFAAFGTWLVSRFTRTGVVGRVGA